MTIEESIETILDEFQDFELRDTDSEAYCVIRGWLFTTLSTALQERDRIAREEAIKECEGCVPEAVKETCGMTCNTCDLEEGYEEWCECSCHKDDVKEWNSCREQTLQAISKLRV